MSLKLKPLWRCPKCHERFVTKNIWHSCGKFTIADLFSKSDPKVVKLFRKFARMARACGPVRMIPQKTRAIFQVRVRFAGCYPRKTHLLCGVALARRLESPRIIKIEEFGSHFIGHQFRVYREEELDEEVQNWLCESYKVGSQETLLQSRSSQRGRTVKKAPQKHTGA